MKNFNRHKKDEKRENRLLLICIFEVGTYRLIRFTAGFKLMPVSREWKGAQILRRALF